MFRIVVKRHTFHTCITFKAKGNVIVKVLMVNYEKVLTRESLTDHHQVSQ